MNPGLRLCPPSMAIDLQNYLEIIVNEFPTLGLRMVLEGMLSGPGHVAGHLGIPVPCVQEWIVFKLATLAK